MKGARKKIIVDFVGLVCLPVFLILGRRQQVHRQTLNREKDIGVLISQELPLQRVCKGNDLGWSG